MHCSVYCYGPCLLTYIIRSSNDSLNRQFIHINNRNNSHLAYWSPLYNYNNQTTFQLFMNIAPRCCTYEQFYVYDLLRNSKRKNKKLMLVQWHLWTLLFRDHREAEKYAKKAALFSNSYCSLKAVSYLKKKKDLEWITVENTGTSY